MLPPHATEEALGRYSLGFLNGEDLALIEEHLLVCGNCRTALSLVDHSISRKRETLPEEEFQEIINAIQRGNILMFK